MKSAFMTTNPKKIVNSSAPPGGAFCEDLKNCVEQQHFGIESGTHNMFASTCGIC